MMGLAVNVFLIILFFQFMNIELSSCKSLPKNLSLPRSTNSDENHVTAAAKQMKYQDKKDTQANKSGKNPVVLGYPRLIESPTSGMPALNQMYNDSTISSTGTPKITYTLIQNSLSAYGVLLLSLVVFAVGIIGNLSIMCIVWHSMSMKSSWDNILAAVALWDFLLLFFCFPVLVFQQITQRRLLGELSCRIIPYMEVSSFGISTFSLCALGIDRFQSATSEISIKPEEHCQSILGKISVIWIGSLTLALPEIFLWQLSQEHSAASDLIIDSCVIKPSPELSPLFYSLILTYKHARMWWFLGCYFCLPILFTITSLLVTLRIVGNAKDKKIAQSQSQLSWIVAGVATVYGMCILPENVTNILFSFTSFDIPYNLLMLITQFFLFVKCAVTPVLLLCISKVLGQAFMDCCCCCCNREHKPGHIQKAKEITTPNCTNGSELQLGTPC